MSFGVPSSTGDEGFHIWRGGSPEEIEPGDASTPLQAAKRPRLERSIWRGGSPTEPRDASTPQQAAKRPSLEPSSESVDENRSMKASEQPPLDYWERKKAFSRHCFDCLKYWPERLHALIESPEMDQYTASQLLIDPKMKFFQPTTIRLLAEKAHGSLERALSAVYRPMLIGRTFIQMAEMGVVQTIEADPGLLAAIIKAGNTLQEQQNLALSFKVLCIQKKPPTGLQEGVALRVPADIWRAPKPLANGVFWEITRQPSLRPMP